MSFETVNRADALRQGHLRKGRVRGWELKRKNEGHEDGNKFCYYIY